MKNLICIITCLFALNTSMAFAESGHSHSHGHSHTPHDGVLSSFSGSDNSGYIELKLHDDKGDLELWLSNADQQAPFDIHLASDVTVRFLNIENKAVTLKARNKVNNEDEDGKGNIRGNNTNYFIFPGDSGESAEFLVGKHFSSHVAVSFMLDGVVYKTKAFLLTPHTH